MMPNFKVIMFDFDGVLGRTMDDNYLAWKHALAGQSIDFEKEEYFVLEGMNAASVAKHFLGPAASDMALVNKTVEAKEDYYLKNNKFALHEDVEQVLKKLKNDDHKLGLVSGASMKRLKQTLDQEFLELFKTIVTGDKVKNCKPHPEPYLTAAGDMAVKSSECIAVENAPLGIRSAKAAGMYCVALTSTLKRRHLLAADTIIDNISQLLTVLDAEKARRA